MLNIMVHQNGSRLDHLNRHTDNSQKKKALEWWKTQMKNGEGTSQAIRSIVKSLMKADAPKLPTAIHGHLRLNSIR
jgi:hypothetical protein